MTEEAPLHIRVQVFVSGRDGAQEATSYALDCREHLQWFFRDAGVLEHLMQSLLERRSVTLVAYPLSPRASTPGEPPQPPPVS